MGIFYEFESVDAFTTGAVGRPGKRTFFIQAYHNNNRISLKCEKQQVSGLAQLLRRILSDLPPAPDRPLASTMNLIEPEDAAFIVGTIGIGYDPRGDRVVVQLEENNPGDDDGDPLPDLDGQLRVYISRSQAEAFCERAELVVDAGRPDCRWCHLPVNPDGHLCPRMN